VTSTPAQRPFARSALDLKAQALVEADGSRVVAQHLERGEEAVGQIGQRLHERGVDARALEIVVDADAAHVATIQGGRRPRRRRGDRPGPPARADGGASHAGDGSWAVNASTRGCRMMSASAAVHRPDAWCQGRSVGLHWRDIAGEVQR
jgi:hypothetical protein